MDLVISGGGAVSPYGVGTAALLDGALTGRTAIERHAGFADLGESAALAGRAPEVERAEGFPVRFRRLPRCNRMALLAAAQAIGQGRLSPESAGTSTGVFYCTNHGPAEQTCRYLDALYLKSPRLVSPLLFQNTTFAAGAGELSMHFRIKGPSQTLASGFHAFFLGIELAALAIETGRVEQALVVATDELIPLHVRALARLGLACRPSRVRGGVGTRAGFVPAEGAAAIVLERRASARARGVEPLGAVAGVGIAHAARGDRHADPDGVRRAVRRALAAAGREPDEVDAVFLSASGLAPLDAAEARALDALGLDGGTPRTAPKSLFGEAFAAAPALQTLLALDALRHARVPPSAPQGGDAAGAEHLRDVAVQRPLDVLLLDALALGGAAASLVLEKAREPTPTSPSTAADPERR